VGTYVLRTPDTTVNLTLNQNGNFDQIIHQANKQPIEVRGTWEWNEKLRMVILNDAIDIRNGKPGMKMIVAIPVVKSFGRIRLDVDPDTGYPYRKTEH
jgi:hypothetical protein